MTILITGATDGIGLETAIQLARQGRELVLHGRNAEKVQLASEAVLREVSASQSARCTCRFGRPERGRTHGNRTGDAPE